MIVCWTRQKKRFLLKMLSFAFIAAFSCTPIPDLPCTRDINPVCVNDVQYNNECLARAAGYHSECAYRVANGPCRNRDVPVLPEGLNCGPNEIYSELGRCVPKPWSDFMNCAEEVRQGACPLGNNPNPWVGEHCTITCARFHA